MLIKLCFTTDIFILCTQIVCLRTLPDMNTITSDVELLQSFDISELDVYNALINLDLNKAVGIDGISPKVLKYCAESLVQPLCHLFKFI